MRQLAKHAPDIATSDAATPDAAALYTAPKLIRLGTLAALTQGGTAGVPDGFGGAGDVGSF